MATTSGAGLPELPCAVILRVSLQNSDNSRLISEVSGPPKEQLRASAEAGSYTDGCVSTAWLCGWRSVLPWAWGKPWLSRTLPSWRTPAISPLCPRTHLLLLLLPLMELGPEDNPLPLPPSLRLRHLPRPGRRGRRVMASAPKASPNNWRQGAPG